MIGRTMHLLEALNPARNVVVEACAGSGKTWLLVSRMLRLLLAGAEPQELLAITFTRKAAQEMRERLYRWLEDLAVKDADEVVAFLRARGFDASEARSALPAARGLFERVLMSAPGPMITTFHGWFLHLLQRAPLQARGPTALLEDAALLGREAWLTYAESLGSREGSDEERAFRALLAEFPLDSVHALLTAFLNRRAEWWAWADERSDALGDALADLQRLSGVTEDEDVLGALLAEADFVEGLREYWGLLAKNGTGVKQDARHARVLEEVLAGPSVGSALSPIPSPRGRGGGVAPSPPAPLPGGEGGVAPSPPAPLPRPFPPRGRGAMSSPPEWWEALQKVFLTEAGGVRALKLSKAMAARLGAAGAARFCALHAALAERILATRDRLSDQRALKFNRWALSAGLGLLTQYQRLKAERDVLDFTDAEWGAWRLLADEELGPAVLARLDARWRHILLDEFQDTNPLQWQALRAWLDAYGLDGARPTLFLVGDPKQSIYRFRRAEPRLFGEAADWLKREWGALYLPLDTTRRLAPRVAAWVNAVFGGRDDYPGFQPHVAVESALPGLCEVMVAARAGERPSPPAPLPGGEGGVAPSPLAPLPEGEGALRDPLREPAPDDPEPRAEEARRVAERIQDLVGRVGVHEGGGSRPARYGDIFVLAASRNQLGVFEQALKRVGIPYVGARRGGLLDTLEAADLMALIAWLVGPANDLALAQVLRSPVFAFTDAHLLALTERTGEHWYARLQAWSEEAQAPGPVRRAATLLAGWLAQAGRVPAHDLLDRVFHEGEVEARYAAAAPPHLRAGVLANLRELLALSLVFSSGRYPSLPRFLDELRALRDRAGDEAPDEPPAVAEDAVRLLTIHAAKGLEAPIVFLIKADESGREQDPYGVVLDWPADAARPRHFSLHGPMHWRGGARAGLFAEEQVQVKRERLNLLYVAMTRARQVLVVSGLDEARPGSWLDLVRQGLERAEMSGLPLIGPCAPSVPEPSGQVVCVPAVPGAPVGTRREPAGEEAEWGVRVHRYLELACRGWEEAAIERDLNCPAADFERIRAHARALLAAPPLRRFFDPAHYRAAHNELAFIDQGGELRRIDRLVEFEHELWVLDYKTGGLTEPDLARRAQPHLEQLAAYRQAMAALYPDRPVRAALIFADGLYYEPGA